MRLIFLILLCYWPASLYGQTVKAVKIKAYNAQCVPESPSSPALEVSIYQMPMDTLVLQTSQNSFNGEMTDEALVVPGKYLARYQNLVGQLIEREIVLGDRDTAIGFCMDSLLSYPQNTLAQFKDKDSLVLLLTASACAGPIERKIEIVCNGNILIASLFRKVYEDVNGGSVEKDSLIRTVIMDERRKIAFMRFENELSQVRDKESESTTEIEFDMRSPYFNLRKNNIFQRWGGFGVLCESLFEE